MSIGEPGPVRERTTSSAAETEEAAARFAAALRGGDRVLLFGELGAGKTAFVRGLVRGLGSPHAREVASPTFALHHRYPGGRLVVDHVDLYRLKPPVDLEHEGLDDVVAAKEHVLCCEWPERLRTRPSGRVALVRLIPTGEFSRRLRFEAGSPDAAPLVEAAG